MNSFIKLCTTGLISSSSIFILMAHANAADVPIVEEVFETVEEVSKSRSGLYISGRIGAATLDHEIERDTDGVVLPVPDVGGTSHTDSTNFSGGLAIGYQTNVHNDTFFIGAEAFIDYEGASTRNINGVLITDVDLNYSYGARALVGANVTDAFSLYVHAGATALDFDVTNSYTFADPVTTASETEVGFSYGVGAIYDFSDRIGVFTEYTALPDLEFDGIPEIAGGTNRVNPNTLDLHKVSLGLRYYF